MNAAIQALRDDVADDAGALLRRLDQSVEFDAATATPTELSHTALAIHHSYCALESLIERCLRHFDGGLPTGHDSHSELLRRASRPIPNVRPQLISVESATAARELLKFRHFLRHVYGAELDPARLAAVQGSIRSGRPLLARDLTALDAWLDSVASLQA